MWASSYVTERSPLTMPAWLPRARVLFVVVALYLFSAPGLVQVLLRRRRNTLAARGLDIDRLSLLMAVSGAAAVAIGALFTQAFFGESVQFVYLWSAASFFVALLWCWRFREVLA